MLRCLRPEQKAGLCLQFRVEEIAKEEVDTRCGSKGVLCLVLDCAVRRGIAFCMRDCESFPCEKHYEWCFPYEREYLEMHKKRMKNKKRSSYVRF